MKIKKILSLLLVFVMMSSLCLAACTNDQGENDATTDSTAPDNTENNESSESSGNGGGKETSEAESSDGTEAASKTETTEKTEETTEPEEETEVITDVMIGETLEAEYAADFSVAKVFSNDMVVQRNEHIRVWGFAPASENGKKVSGSFKGMFAEAIIENGEWCITFGARLDADVNGAEMKIYTDNKTITFEGVLVGDVYLVLGQSNAAYNVNNHLTYNDPTTQGGSRNDIDPNSIIRLNFLNGSGGSYSKLGTDYVYSDLTNTKYWTKTTEADTLSFSALGYYFAKQMTEKDPTVPIGLMEVAVGGAPLVSFLPNELADEFGGDYKDITNGIYYSTITTEHKGRYLYNCYLAPVSRYAVAGVLWYQGESNNSLQNSMEYNETFAALMTHLRSTHNVVNKDFPIFITEFPSIYQKPADFSSSWHFMELGIIRSYMGSIPNTLKNSYVAVSSDLWADKTFYNSLHPNCKYEQAGRLALLADFVINKKGSLAEATGPIFKDVQISADKKTVIITFTNVGEGLATQKGGNNVLGLVGLLDKNMGHSTVAPVSATITAKNQITVVFDAEVKAVAYNYHSSDFYGDTLNLCNSFGCPASAFITPYEERKLDNIKENTLVDIKTSYLGLKGKSYDTLTAGGQNVIEVGYVENHLTTVGSVDIPEGTVTLGMYGWIGFNNCEVLMFGYSIDGADIVFNSYPIAAGQAVINAGGKNAVRFNVLTYINELSLGEHTVTLAAYVDARNGVAVKMISYKINIVERQVAPEGVDYPLFNDAGYALNGHFYDAFSVDSAKKYEHSDIKKLNENGGTVSVQKGTQTLRLEGWMGFGYPIDVFGYSIDGNAPIMTSAPITPEKGVIDAAGEYAMRYSVFANISDLDVGLHTVDFLVRINVDGEKTILKILSFTLEITE